MELKDFAEAERLKTRPDKVGHIWEYGDGRLGVILLNLTVRKWNH